MECSAPSPGLGGWWGKVLWQNPMQQKTSVLPSGHPLRALTGLARQIALPHEHAPLRFPSFPALERTAVMGFNAPAQVNLPANTPVKFLVTRQAAYPVWADQTIDACGMRVAWQTTSTLQNGGNDTTMFYETAALNGVNVTVQSQSSNRVGTSADCFGGYPLESPPLGVDARTGGSTPYAYVPAGWSAMVVVSGVNLPFATGPCSAVVNFDMWMAPGETSTQLVTLGGHVASQYSMSGTLTATPTGGRWLRPSSVVVTTSGSAFDWPDSVVVSLLTSSVPMNFTNGNTTWGAVTKSGSASPSVGLLPLVSPVEFFNSTLPWLATRTTAASLLLTNVSQVLTKAGTVLAGRVSPNVISPWVVSSAYVNNLHPAEKAFLPLETGFYTYCPPSTDMAEFWDYASVSNSGFSGTTSPGNVHPLYRLDNDAMVNVAFLTAGATAEQVAANVDWHIEFRTSSALFQVGLCSMTLETLHSAQIVLAMGGFFFENNWHKRILDKIISGAKAIAPYAYTALSAVNPAAAKVVRGAYMLTQAPRTNVPATSGARSGIIRPAGTGKKRKKARAAKPKKGKAK